MSHCDNKKSLSRLFHREKFETGLVLEGWEVKAIRAGRVQLKEAYVVIKKRCGISDRLPHQPTLVSVYPHPPRPTRSASCCCHASEINKLIGKQPSALALPWCQLNMHFSKGRIKLDIGLAKGKKQHDKRATEKDREWNVEKQRLVRSAQH